MQFHSAKVPATWTVRQLTEALYRHETLFPAGPRREPGTLFLIDIPRNPLASGSDELYTDIGTVFEAVRYHDERARLTLKELGWSEGKFLKHLDITEAGDAKPSVYRSWRSKT